MGTKLLRKIDSYTKNTDSKVIHLDYVIVRTKSAGAHAGELLSRYGSEATLLNSRRLWYWEGAASLSQLAVSGTSKPERCKFPCEVPKTILIDVIEVLFCTDIAFNSIKKVKIWKA